ncbi:hypothetical protein D1BOALGB6SA_10094 [Olavius sp. associated proteobacterium Delta 1]|nr:hypothetical protein D1BOALGB6SA_10094 [Olavius sp. associated proteobacterium Delta 1]
MQDISLRNYLKLPILIEEFNERSILMIPKNITQKHILLAVKEINEKHNVHVSLFIGLKI